MTKTLNMRREILSGLLGLVWGIAANAQSGIDTASFERIKNETKLTQPNTFVAIGEAHDIAGTYATEFYMIKELAALGYKNLFIEAGISEAYILNEYLATGNDSLLLYTRARNHAGAYKGFIKQLYDLNKRQRVPFSFVGIDFERSVCVGYLFHRWFNESSADNELFRKQLKLLLSINEKITSADFEIVFKTVNENEPALRDLYKTVLKENYEVFMQIIHGGTETTFRKRNVSMAGALLSSRCLDKIAGGILIIGNNHLAVQHQLADQVYPKLLQSCHVVTFFFVYRNCKDLYYMTHFTSDKFFLKRTPETDGKTEFIRFGWPTKKLLNFPKTEHQTIVVQLNNQ